jgi:pre-peptidase
MNRLTSGTVSLIALLVVSGCNNDSTEDLRGPVSRIQATPSTLNVTQGKTKTIQVSALDDQGNLIPSAYEVSAVGSGISVKRDSSFFEQFVGDSLTVPATAPTWQFIVSGTDLVATSFVVSAAGQQVTIPVVVSADPANVPVSTVTSTGPSASDETVITAPDPYIFGPDAAVTFDAGAAIVLGISDDGKTITIFPPPGATSKGIITGLIVPYLPQAPVSDSTDVALTISATVPPQAGTDDPATAPEVALPPSGGTTAFYDGAAFASPVCGESNAGAPCQLYKITLPADGSIDATLGWSNTADLGLYVLSADGTTDVIGFPDSGCDVLGNADEGGEETCTFDLAAGTYILAVAFFGPFYDPPDPAPDWISLSISSP